MTCKDFENIVSDYLENSLPEEKQKETKHHLGLCPACRRMMEGVSWVMTECEAFPAFTPPAHLKRNILEKTTLKNPWWKTTKTIAILLEWRKIPLAYALSFVIMIFMTVNILWNVSDLLKGANKQMHQLYSSGVKFYYETEKFKEEMTTLKEDFPNRIDSGIVKSIDWIKNKMKKDGKKEDEKGKANERPNSYYFSA